MSRDLSYCRAERIAKTIESAGGLCYLTGSWTADLCANTPKPDYELEVFGISMDSNIEIRQWLKYTHFKLEYVSHHKSVFTMESKLYEDSAKFQITFLNPEIEATPSQSFKRKYFSMDCIYLSPFRKFWVDPFKGKSDILNKEIRLISKPADLNNRARAAMRAAYLAAKYGMSLSRDSLDELKKIDWTFVNLNGAEVFEELKNVLMSPFPAVGFYYWEALGIIELVPHFDSFFGFEGVERKNQRATQTRLGITKIRSLFGDLSYEKRLTLMISILLCNIPLRDLNNKEINELFKDNINCYLFSEKSGRKAFEIIEILTYFKLGVINGLDIKEQVIKLVGYQRLPEIWSKYRTATLTNYLRLQILGVDIDLLNRISQASMESRGSDEQLAERDWFIKKSDFMGLTKTGSCERRYLSGDDLMKLLNIEQGPMVGELLQYLEVLQIGGVINNRDRAEEEAITYYNVRKESSRQETTPQKEDSL